MQVTKHGLISLVGKGPFWGCYEKNLTAKKTTRKGEAKT